MANVITALETSAGPTALWATFTDAVPYIGLMMVFGFGFYLLRRITKRGTKGKGGF